MTGGVAETSCGRSLGAVVGRPYMYTRAPATLRFLSGVQAVSFDASSSIIEIERRES